MAEYKYFKMHPVVVKAIKLEDLDDVTLSLLSKFNNIPVDDIKKCDDYCIPISDKLYIADAEQFECIFKFEKYSTQDSFVTFAIPLIKDLDCNLYQLITKNKVEAT